MASTSSPILQILRPRCRVNTTVRAAVVKLQPESLSAGTTRRQALLFFTATAAIAARENPSMAEDIPLFGLRKKLKKVEEEAEEIVREGFEAAEKGIETAERGIVTAERGIEAAEREIETAEKEIETALNFGALSQAGAVAGAEVVGVLVATSIVNGILGPEGQS
ncbi:uncharacterized protein LOC111025160 [Momordica charantia]|uniref:Uncharacterized protein LOC111025160 n=1 Tax=Momordica charantia TaxID=3673 RepID=A0A6J1E1P9_MOMCH|nr:uncharacterized protein LOC111025160 [Momordica charantia]